MTPGTVKLPKLPDPTSFRSWPLAAVSIAAFTFAFVLLETGTAEESNDAAEALFVLGAVLLGAWIAMLARGGHRGFTDDDE